MQSTIEGVYVIYSADVLSASGFPADLDPTQAYGHRPAFPQFTETEGDEQYDFGYLADESGDTRYYPYGMVEREGTEPADDDEPTGEGCHRKWVADLSRADWEAFASAFCIDLDDDGMPERFEETMGSITEHGHIPAVAVDMSEGWAPLSVIWARAYVSPYSSTP